MKLYSEVSNVLSGLHRSRAPHFPKNESTSMKSEAIQSFFRRINREINWLRSDLKRIGSYRSWFPVGRRGRKIKLADGSTIRWQEIPFPAGKRTHVDGAPIPSERLQSNWGTHRDIRADYNEKRCDGISEFLGWFGVECDENRYQCRLENGTLPTVQFNGLEQDVFESVKAICESVREWYIADGGHWVEFKLCSIRRESKGISEQIRRSESRFPFDVHLLDRLQGAVEQCYDRARERLDVQAAVDSAGLFLAGERISASNSTNSTELSENYKSIRNNAIELAGNWLAKPRKSGGPTRDQSVFVTILVESGGWLSHADLSTKGEFDWEDSRLSARKMADRINKSIKDEPWKIDPANNSGCLLLLNDQRN